MNQFNTIDTLLTDLDIKTACAEDALSVIEVDAQQLYSDVLKAVAKNQTDRDCLRSHTMKYNEVLDKS